MLVLPLPLLALDPAKSIFQFNVQNWTRQNGLPSGKVNTVAQTADGYIWLGTPLGLVRFDGLEFKSVAADFPQAQGKEVRKIVPSREGGLLLAINNGGFARYHEQLFSNIADSRWPSEGMTGKTILEARDGAVWIGSNLGAGRSVQGKPIKGWFTETAPLRVFALCEDPAGRIWVGAEGGLFYVNGETRTDIIDSYLPTDVIHSLASDAVGNIWVGMGRELRCFDAQGKLVETPPLAAGINALLVDSRGVVWVGTDRLGLARYQDGEFTFLAATDGLGSNYVTSLFEDAEGSLWVGTREGLSQLTDLKFPLLTEKEGLVAGPAHTVSASRDGGLWITTSTGFSYFDGRKAWNTTKGSVLADSYVKLAHETRNGDLYLVDGEKTISVISGGKRVSRYPIPRWPEALSEDAESVLVGLGPSLWRAREGELQPYEFAAGKVPDFRWFDNMTVARDGGIWIASYVGIFRVKDGEFKQWSFGGAEFSTAARTHYIFEDVDGSIWIGLSSGMARIKDGTLRRIAAKDGLYDDMVFAIVPDDHGYFWIDSSRGIFRVRRQQLNDFADGKIALVRCEAFEGLESLKSTDRIDQEYSGTKTKDGRIWFPNAQGVVMIDPANFFTNKIPPPVHVDEVRVNGVPVKDRENIQLQPDAERVEFFFTALSYIAPQRVQVQYQLEGMDSGWADAGSRRSVVYNRLAPGRYAFRVQARNADGVWSVAEDKMELTLRPHFYQTAWFYTLCGFGGVMTLVGAYRWKVQRLHQQRKKLQAANDLLEEKVGQRTDELADSVSLLKATIDSTADGILAIQFSGKVVSFNSQYAAMWGVRPEQLENASNEDVVAFTAPLMKNPEEFIARIKEVHANPEADAFDLLELKDGRMIERYCKPQRIDAKCVGIVINFRDITERKRAEAHLEKINRQLLETSRQAGMSEIATNVLHNVGNVLNSVNISATIAMEQARESKAANVPKVAVMLQEHLADIGGFLTNDPKGRRIPDYLTALGGELASEQAAMVDELSRLQKNIEHIKEIVAMQQSYAKVSGVTEMVAISDLADDALRLHASELASHGLEVVREYSVRPIVPVDRHKVMQILVNLIQNAKNACQESGHAKKRVKVRISQGDGHVHITVIDDGIGIPPENLTRIFAHGFTTRKHGHGFGLHSGALAAKEIGGALRVHSDGLGKGAAFTLDLPFKPAASGP